MHEGSKYLLAAAVATLLVVAGAAAGVSAQTLQQRVEALERKVDSGQEGISGALGLDVHGLVAGDYLYDFNNPDSRTSQLRVFDTDANSFTLNQANLYVGRNKEDENLGFAVNVDFGKTAEVVGAVTCWTSDCDSAEMRNSFELREAYLTYKLPVGAGISLKAGKFVTLHGAEVIKSYNSVNYAVSNSILFGFAVPFTHTGIMATFPLGDVVTVDLGIVNGWDNVVDNNDGKSLHAGITLKPGDGFSLLLSGTYGPEQPDSGKSKRAMATALATFDATDALTLIADVNYGNESDLIADASRLRSADWYGAAAYAIYAITDRWSVSLRGEIFDDPDGYRTSFQEPPFGPGVTAWEVTPSVSFQVTEGLLWRAEYRHDEADKRIFEKESRFQRGQDTVATELLYAF